MSWECGTPREMISGTQESIRDGWTSADND